MAAALIVRTRVIFSARWKSALMCLAFLPLLLLLVPEARADPLVWWSTSFFAGCGLVGLIQLIWPARLTLAADGLAYAALGRGWSVQWRSIDTLILWRNPAPRASQTLVGWVLRPEARKAGVIAGMSRMLGVDGALPGLWSMSPQALLEIMQDYHAAAVGSDPAPRS